MRPAVGTTTHQYDNLLTRVDGPMGRELRRAGPPARRGPRVGGPQPPQLLLTPLHVECARQNVFGALQTASRCNFPSKTPKGPQYHRTGPESMARRGILSSQVGHVGYDRNGLRLLGSRGHRDAGHLQQPWRHKSSRWCRRRRSQTYIDSHADQRQLVMAAKINVFPVQYEYFRGIRGGVAIAPK